MRVLAPRLLIGESSSVVKRGLGAGEIISIIALVLAGVVWAVRLEGRQNATERELAAQKEHHREVVERVDRDLTYIRGRLDKVLDGRPAPTSGQ